MLRSSRRNKQYQFYILWFDTIGLKYMIYHTEGEHANYYTTDVKLKHHTQGRIMTCWGPLDGTTL